MLKKITILLFSLFLITSNANAGSDGELTLNQNKSETQKTKDCFEKLNRKTFAFNQGLDKALIKPIAKVIENYLKVFKKEPQMLLKIYLPWLQYQIMYYKVM